MQWIELDPWARASGRTFTGTFEQLRDQLLLDTKPDGRVDCSDTHLLLHVEPFIFDKVFTTVAVLRTPWGRSRWIPKPRIRS